MPRLHITREAGQIVLNVRRFFQQESERGARIAAPRVARRIAAATGVGSATLSLLKSESDLCRLTSAADVQAPRPGGALELEELTHKAQLAICKLHLERMEEPTLNSVRDLLASEDLNAKSESGEPMPWVMSRSTFHRKMKEAGFEFSERPSPYEKAKESAKIQAMRADYLEWLKGYRAQGKDIFYQDETWIFKNMSTRKTWNHRDIGAQFASQSGSGQRSIICHLGGSRTGLLNEALLMFKGPGPKKKQPADYHSNMNSTIFLRWLEQSALPAIRRASSNAVLILDRATYHSMLTDFTRPPVISMHKAELIHCVERWGGPLTNWGWPSHWQAQKVKPQLLEAANHLKPAPKYRAQEIADKFGVSILFLPIAHPELNPIEMVWGKVKSICSSRNKEKKLSILEEVAKEEFSKIDEAAWKKYEDHVIKVEDQYIASLRLNDQINIA